MLIVKIRSLLKVCQGKKGHLHLISLKVYVMQIPINGNTRLWAVIRRPRNEKSSHFTFFYLVPCFGTCTLKHAGTLYDVIKCTGTSNPCTVCLVLGLFLVEVQQGTSFSTKVFMQRGQIMIQTFWNSSFHSATTQGPLKRLPCCQSAVGAASTLPDLCRPHVKAPSRRRQPDCV